MGKQLQTVPHTGKLSYLFTATTYSTEREIRATRYFREYVLLSFTFPLTFPPAVLSDFIFFFYHKHCSVNLFQLIAGSVQLYLPRCLPLKHLQIISICYGLPQERQISCISCHSEISILESQKIHKKTFHLLKFLAFCHLICKMNKQA